MATLKFTSVTKNNLLLLEVALRKLADELGDRYSIQRSDLESALLGPNMACHAILALNAESDLAGAALFSPIVSTSEGSVGAFVSDLWIEEAARGQNLGRQMLAQVAREADQLWQARFIRLISYNSNPSARHFYERLGFRKQSGQDMMIIAGKEYEKLKRTE